MKTVANSGRAELWPSIASRDDVRLVSISRARPNGAGVLEESGIPRSQPPRRSWARAWLNQDTSGHDGAGRSRQLCGCQEGLGPNRGISAQNRTRLLEAALAGASGALLEAPRGSGDGFA